MKLGRLLSANNHECLIPKVYQTTNFLERMRGLLFRPPLKKDEALLLTSCNSVHMIGMSYPIDLIYLDNNWVVLKLVEQLKPWRLSACPGAKMVFELPGNSLNNMLIETGQQLEWEDEM